MSALANPESLQVIIHNNVPVVTTELLAQLYGTEPDYIRKNFNRNLDRFIVGKHFFILEGIELREFKHRMSLRPSVEIAKNIRSLILWTERGAARHAKMLETDQAWEVFEKLEDCYFSNHNKDKEALFNGKVVLYIKNGQIDMAQSIDDDYHIGSFDSWRELAVRAGWLVINPDEPIKNLANNLPKLS